MTLWIVLAAVPLVSLAITILNLLTWPRRGRGAGHADGVTIAIPARNEAANIEGVIASCLWQDPERTGKLREILVLDDGSTDATKELALQMAELDDRVRTIDGRPLAEGWVGKPFACHQLYLEAHPGPILFVDADVRLEAGALDRLDSLFRDSGADVLSAAPAQITETFFERLILPLLTLTYTSWLPLFLVSRGTRPSTVAANGQLLLTTRSTLDAMGGFSLVRDEIVDDVAFCRRAKERGLRVAFVDGFDAAHCRMYRNAGDVWRGFSKNLFEGVGGRLSVLVAVSTLYLCAFVLPFIAFAYGLAASNDSVVVAAAVGVFCNVLLRVLLMVRFRHPASSVVLHPIAVLVLVAIAFNSFLWAWRDRISWAGRSYVSRGKRRANPTSLVSREHVT